MRMRESARGQRESASQQESVQREAARVQREAVSALTILPGTQCEGRSQGNPQLRPCPCSQDAFVLAVSRLKLCHNHRHQE